MSFKGVFWNVFIFSESARTDWCEKFHRDSVSGLVPEKSVSCTFGPRRKLMSSGLPLRQVCLANGNLCAIKWFPWFGTEGWLFLTEGSAFLAARWIFHANGGSFGWKNNAGTMQLNGGISPCPARNLSRRNGGKTFVREGHFGCQSKPRKGSPFI